MNASLRAARVRLAYLRDIAAYLLPHIRRERARALVGTALALVAAGFGVLSALLTAAVLDLLRGGQDTSAGAVGIDWDRLLDLNTAGGEVTRLLSGMVGRQDSVRSSILVIGALLLGSTALAVVANTSSRWLWIGVRTRVIAEMQVGLFDHLLFLPMGFHVRNRVGGLLSRMGSDVGNVAWLLPTLFHTVLRTPLLLAGSLVAMLRTSLQLTLITLSAAVAYLVFNFVLGRLVRQSYTKQSVARASLLSLAQEALVAVRVVKVFGAERAEVREMRAELDQLVREEIRGDLLSAQFPEAVNQLLSAAATIVVAIAGLNMVAARELTEPGLVLFLVASIALLLTSAVVAQSMMSLNVVAGSAGRILELYRVRTELVDGELEARAFERTLRLRDVTFTYGDEPVLQDVRLTIRKGEVIGVVGPSGSGKSTLADLLLRLYDPAAGTVELDGVDVRRFTQDSYRRLFGVVPQEALLFNDTVHNNIAYGRPDLGDEDVVAAARIANAHDFITALPDGYGTLVGERGTRLSGGERQRIAIARAIAARPPVLIFDEATSALDNESERLVQDAIERAIGGHTAIVIAHRISTVQNADRIVVLERGRLVESGTHAELLRLGGLYRRLYEAGTTEPRSLAAGALATPAEAR